MLLSCKRPLIPFSPMPQPDPDTLNRLHRWFAIECNNNAWDLLEKDPLSNEDQRTLLSTAYASAYHWSRIGKPINRVRSDMLLAQVHARTGDIGKALLYAEAAIKGLDDPDSTDWDRAFGHIVLARIAAFSGHTHRAKTARDTAQLLARKLKGEERATLEGEVTTVTQVLEDTY